MTKQLIVIRHSTSEPIAGSSAHAWQLTDEGRRKCTVLAKYLHPYGIGHIYSSDEPKAVETAALVAQNLGGLPVTLDAQLRETQRETAPYFADINDFTRAIQLAMNQPRQLLYGEETFEAARIRFAEAVNRVVANSGTETVALVSHGTILSLYIGSVIGKHPFDVWKMLRTPAYLVFALPDMTVGDVWFALPDA